jgi:aryl-alcohol dehydrogenase-like predicted oxidoreductase
VKNAPLELRNLGTSGLRVSAVGLGCNNLGGRLDPSASRVVVQAALTHGITLFDTADRYPVTAPGRSEELLGDALGRRRADVVVATKFGLPMDAAGVQGGASRRYIMSAVEASLRRLKTDWIDLYQVHMPDPHTPIEETICALDDLIAQGKIRYAGCSNFAAWHVTDAIWTAKDLKRTAFISCQDEYSLLARDIERELVPAMVAHGLGFLPYFPLASGLLSGKYRGGALPAGTRLATTKPLIDQFLTAENLAGAERLGDFAEAHGHTPLELAISWLLSRPTVASVIAGASNPQQIEQNVAAATWTFTADELAAIDALAPGPKKAGH